MTKEFAYVIVTNNVLIRGKIGYLVQRLPSDLDLVVARMFAPSPRRIKSFAQTISPSGSEVTRTSEQLRAFLIREYIQNNPHQTKRALFLGFYGPNAREKIERATGQFFNVRIGEQLRGEFAVFDATTKTINDPAVFISPAKVPQREIRKRAGTWAARPYNDSGILEYVADDDPDYAGKKLETTLVMIKPEIIEHGANRIGNVWALFERAGKYLVGASMVQMSLRQASSMYGHLYPAFERRLASDLGERVKRALSEELEFPIPDETLLQIINELNPLNARHEFYAILNYMTGKDPYKFKDPRNNRKPGTARCLTLIYRGPNAISDIREILGHTNPREAGVGTVRHLWGNDTLQNAAHASDSQKSYLREKGILRVGKITPHQDLKPYL